MTLKLRYNPMSPYIRKVVVMVAETGLEDQVERVLTHPWTENSDIRDVNPLGKVPALELEDGTNLYDSLVICDYLDTLHDGPKMIPTNGMDRWIVLRRHALGIGVTDTAALHLFEQRRIESQQSPGWKERQWGAAMRGLDQAERESGDFADQLDLGQLGIACAIGLIDFRYPRVRLARFAAEALCLVGQIDGAAFFRGHRALRLGSGRPRWAQRVG